MEPLEEKGAGVLRLLRSGGGGFISGQRMSEELSISRTAVWKHIGGLKKMGYAIEASPSKGYRLAPGITKPFNALELASGLATELIGKKIFFYDELVSTNATACELASRGAPEGTVVVADSQSGGKGRLGRDWFSPPGKNLYTSIILRPAVAPAQAPALTLVFAVAVSEAVGLYTNKRPSVKWPNDVLLDSMKVAGILMEMNSEVDRVNHIVCGIGVNLNMTQEMLPKGINRTAVSLMEKNGSPVPRAEFAQRLYSSVEKWYKIFTDKGLKPIIKAWRGHFDSEGKPVSVNTIDRTIEGICMGIDERGSLILRVPSGELLEITSGDMSEVV